MVGLESMELVAEIQGEVERGWVWVREREAGLVVLWRREVLGRRRRRDIVRDAMVENWELQRAVALSHTV